MLACFRNNLPITNILIDAEANVLKEDNHGRMTLCYAISASLKSKPPYLVAERVLKELKRRSAIEIYLKSRIEIIISIGKKRDVSASTCEMLVKIVQFAVQFIDGAVKILLDYHIFQQLRDVIFV